MGLAVLHQKDHGMELQIIVRDHRAALSEARTARGRVRCAFSSPAVPKRPCGTGLAACVRSVEFRSKASRSPTHHSPMVFICSVRLEMTFLQLELMLLLALVHLSLPPPGRRSSPRTWRARLPRGSPRPKHGDPINPLPIESFW
jgi:hypothetical protein